MVEIGGFPLLADAPFDKEIARKWFEHEGIEDENVFQLIWDYFGGAAIYLVDAMRVYKQKGRQELEDFLLDEAKIYRGKLSHFIAEILEELNEKRMFKESPAKSKFFPCGDRRT